MFPISNVLNRVVVAQFYKQNTGLFLFIFFIMFGMVEGSQLVYYHLSLMTGIVQSTAFLGVVLLLWLAYSIKSSQVVVAQLVKPQNAFLYVLTALSRTHQLVNLLMVHLLIHLPVWLYAIATSLVALHQGRFTIALLILGFNFFICVAMSLVSVHQLNHPASFSLPLFSRIKLPFKKPLFWFYLGFVMNDALVILVVTKLFSYLALFGFFQIPLDHYENRIPLMGILIGATAHAVLIYEVRKWEDSYLTFAKNLPIHTSTRYFTLAIVCVLLIVPELFLLITNHVHLLDVAGTFAFGIGLLLLFHALLYPLSMNMDRYIQFILIIFLASFALILFSLSWLLIAIYFMGSFRLYRKYFYTSESLKL